MSDAAETSDSSDALDEGVIHDVLRNDRRRLTLQCLQEGDGSATVRDLSEEIATRETGEEPPPRNKRQSVYVSLHQTHLPKLDELDIVTYDGEEKSVSLGEAIDEVEVYMEVVPQYGISWAEFYFGLALLGALTSLAVLVGVPRISALQVWSIALVFFCFQMAVATYHVYTHQDRTVVERLFGRP